MTKPKANPRVHPWSIAENARLAAHVAEDRSLSSAVALLPGRTRNAVLGRWLRIRRGMGA